MKKTLREYKGGLIVAVIRVLSEKKKGFDVEAQGILADLRENLGVTSLNGVRVIHRYDVENVERETIQKSLNVIFSEPMVDDVRLEEWTVEPGDTVFAIEYLPGQYDQRADSTKQAIAILSGNTEAEVRCAKVYVLSGTLTEAEVSDIKAYLINATDSREALLEKPVSLQNASAEPADVEIVSGFTELREEELPKFLRERGFAMRVDDLRMVRDYFRDEEKRNPSITELKMIDTYWSDHCRHSTFETLLKKVEIEPGKFSEPIQDAYNDYRAVREFVYGDREPKNLCMMDMATIAMKEMRKNGVLDDLEVSGEINACSVEVDVDENGENKRWLLMFKNETHNHPTEIEPFGGAATCLGGAIRDPLSGRAYVYQAMRITGAADPTGAMSETLPGKLPQIKITRTAANGYSSYGNQIGIATGQVREIYDPGYVAKRLELGAVIGAVPKDWVVREEPSPTDVIILLGGRTGRDGLGGATGSSKSHTESSILSSGAEVQKGNAPTERKILRLFRREEVVTLIKRCNDFGAGGVSVAIGELAPGLSIDLDAVPKKYEGLDGTELAISESQERMAVVVAKENVEKFMALAAEENLEATRVAVVTESPRLVMHWRGKKIVDLSRAFLDTNGALGTAEVRIRAPKEDGYFRREEVKDVRAKWMETVSDLNHASQKGLVEKFDASVGASTVLLPLGGKHQLTVEEGMVSKFPVLSGKTTTASCMSFGFHPEISKWSPFHGALYAVVESVSKLACFGCDPMKIRLSFQEFFGKLGDAKEKWGLPVSALLGGLVAQRALLAPAIGGKDSMSGTFEDLDVPPTLVSFAVSTANADRVVSASLKGADNAIFLLRTPMDEKCLPDFDILRENLNIVSRLVREGKLLAASTVKDGGVAMAISNMAFGNEVGVRLSMPKEELFFPAYGSFLLEIAGETDVSEVLPEGASERFEKIGRTLSEPVIEAAGVTLSLEELRGAWEKPLEKVFPTAVSVEREEVPTLSYDKRAERKNHGIAKPKVLITAFPGTNSEYDSKRAFVDAGAEAEIFVFRNRNLSDIEASVEELSKKIAKSQIVMIPGGFSAGDEPEGSGKFIAAVFRNPKIAEAIHELLHHRDGLMLGICNGFQALIKLGLLPYGEIRELDAASPTLTYNRIGRHMAKTVETRIASVMSPWMAGTKTGDIFRIPISHGEGRFVATDACLKELAERGQIAAQYVDPTGQATMDIRFNPNGSAYAVEAITDPSGRVLGKMGHSERYTENCFKNIGGDKLQPIFDAGVNYFK